jgi:hypothetical protein
VPPPHLSASRARVCALAAVGAVAVFTFFALVGVGATTGPVSRWFEPHESIVESRYNTPEGVAASAGGTERPRVAGRRVDASRRRPPPPARPSVPGVPPASAADPGTQPTAPQSEHSAAGPLATPEQLVPVRPIPTPPVLELPPALPPEVPPTLPALPEGPQVALPPLPPLPVSLP